MRHKVDVVSEETPPIPILGDLMRGEEATVTQIMIQAVMVVVVVEWGLIASTTMNTATLAITIAILTTVQRPLAMFMIKLQSPLQLRLRLG